MAKLERTLSGSFDSWLDRIVDGILSSSLSATLEDGSDFCVGDARCSVRVFARFISSGANRVSMNVTLFQSGDGPIFLSGITSGGSQAVFFKFNTLGEEAFLDKLSELL